MLKLLLLLMFYSLKVMASNAESLNIQSIVTNINDNGQELSLIFEGVEGNPLTSIWYKEHSENLKLKTLIGNVPLDKIDITYNNVSNSNFHTYVLKLKTKTKKHASFTLKNKNEMPIFWKSLKAYVNESKDIDDYHAMGMFTEPNSLPFDVLVNESGESVGMFADSAARHFYDCMGQAFMKELTVPQVSYRTSERDCSKLKAETVKNLIIKHSNTTDINFSSAIRRRHDFLSTQICPDRLDEKGLHTTEINAVASILKKANWMDVTIHPLFYQAPCLKTFRDKLFKQLPQRIEETLASGSLDWLSENDYASTFTKELVNLSVTETVSMDEKEFQEFILNVLLKDFIKSPSLMQSKFVSYLDKNTTKLKKYLQNKSSSEEIDTLELAKAYLQPAFGGLSEFHKELSKMSAMKKEQIYKTFGKLFVTKCLNNQVTFECVNDSAQSINAIEVKFNGELQGVEHIIFNI